MARRLRSTATRVVDTAAVTAGYRRWLRRQPLAARTVDAYLAQPDAQPRWLRAGERSASPRDRAIATVIVYIGVRLPELAALDVVDVGVGPAGPAAGGVR